MSDGSSSSCSLTPTGATEDQSDSDSVGTIEEETSELDSSDREDLNADELLGEWLSQLQSLSEGLDGVRPTKMPSRCVGATGDICHPSTSLAAEMKTESPRLSSGKRPPPIPLKPAVSPGQRPAVMPKPTVDLYRLSRVNLEESADVDLDKLLGELCELESQLNADNPESFFKILSTGDHKTVARPLPASNNNNFSHLRNGQATTDLDRELCVQQHRNSTPNKQLTVDTNHTDPLKVSADCPRTQSPDSDSAFCDSASLLSSESAQSSTRNRDSNGSSADSSRVSLITPSPTQLLDQVQSQIRHVEEEVGKENLTKEEKEAKVKAEKIRIAMEKMAEASIKKIYVKIYTSDGGSKSLLVDERWNVEYVLRCVAEKNHVVLTPHHCIVEYYPDLFMERIYEDSEHVVDNILLWTRDSPNKLVFLEKQEKYDLFDKPQVYLLGNSHSDRGLNMERQRKQQLIEEFFSHSTVQPPELESVLLLKTEGKKAWKKHLFVLRKSGIYYVPKGKTKGSKDLVCLMQLEMVEVYFGINWKKKYKAPTEFGFALKHPKIQVKASKYIKYLCAEDESTLQRWIVGIRIAKNGRQLYDNYKSLLELVEAKRSQKDTPSAGSDSEPITPLTTTTGIFGVPANGVVDTRDVRYLREAIVMRPNSARHSNVDVVADIKLRPQSADMNGISSKRNSKTLLPVDLPSVPSDSHSPREKSTVSSFGSEYGSSSHLVSGSSLSQVYFNGCQGGSQTPTAADSISLSNAFESDLCATGTIKKRPAGVLPIDSRGGSSPSLGARMPLTETTRHIHSQAVDVRTRNLSNCDTVSNHSDPSIWELSASQPGDDCETDSDEDLPPPPSDLQVELVQTDGEDEFDSLPPPPAPTEMVATERLSGESPAPLNTSYLHRSSVGAINGQRSSAPLRDASGQRKSMSSVHVTPASPSNFHNRQSHNGRMSEDISPAMETFAAAEVFGRKTSNSLSRSQEDSLHVVSSRQSVSSLSSTGSGGKAKPPPPRRSENTRLSAVPVGTSPDGQLSPDCHSNSSGGSAGRSAEVSPQHSVSTAPPTKPKPMVAAKPKSTLPAVAAAAVSNGDGFMSELERAMQRRQHKLNLDPSEGNGVVQQMDSCAADCTCPQPPQLTGASRVSGKLAPPPPPKRSGAT